MRLTAAPLAALVALAVIGCGGTTSRSPATTAQAPPTPGFKISSPAFSPGARIPALYTCASRDISLPLRFSGVPRGTKELVLIMRDIDAPGGNFTHWALAGISPRDTGLRAGAVPSTARAGRNSFGSLGYRGPCPPRGDPPHRYVISLTALSSPSRLGTGFSADQFKLTRPVPVAMLTGTFARR